MPLIIASVASCAPLPTVETTDENSAVLHLENTAPIPPLVDFHGVTITALELDGLEWHKINVARLPAGKHRLMLRAEKGPTGMFGRAPLMGSCEALLDFEVAANKQYDVRLVRDQDAPFIRVIDLSNKEVVTEAPCK